MTRTPRRAVLLALVLAFFAGELRGDWKSDLLALIAPPRPDYTAAWIFLSKESASFEPEDKQTAGALLPYLASKIGERVVEEDLAAAYFETYRDNDPDLSFLDDLTRRDFLAFWVRWKRAYPLIYDVSLLSYPSTGARGLPGTVDVGLELLNEALYRISLGPYILEGGWWPRGFHILSVPVGGLFSSPQTIEFVLDLKAGDLIVRKPIRLEIDVADLAPTTAPSLSYRSPASPSSTSGRAIQEGEISVYVDGKLVLRSRKIAAKPAALDFPLPGPSMPGQKPYLPPPKDDPMSHGVSILDALALAYKALKDLVAKRPPLPSPPSYQKTGSLSFVYTRTTAEGKETPARASITLVPVKAVIYRE